MREGSVAGGWPLGSVMPDRLAPPARGSRQPPTAARWSAVRSASLNAGGHGPLPASTYGGTSTEPNEAASVTYERAQASMAGRSSS